MRAGRVLVPIGGQRKCAIDRAPELRQRIRQPIPIGGRAGRRRELRLSDQRVVEISPDALELLGPGHHRVGAIVIQHVAHRQPQLVQIVLNAQELQRILAIPLDQATLERPQSDNLALDIERVCDDGRERQDKANQEARRRRATVLRAWRHEGRVSETSREKRTASRKPRTARFDTAPKRSQS